MTTAAKSEYLTEERCYITELYNSDDDPAVSVAHARVEPGTTTKRHRLIGTEERYVILQGAGSMSVGQSAARSVGVGDTVNIPAGAEQNISNTGSTDLILLCICTPRFEWARYESLE
jgi:mannose-6-phosphate isomerase-like protein (cupin superfamily)